MNSSYKYFYLTIIINLLIYFPRYNLNFKQFNKKAKLIREITKVYKLFHKVNINKIEEIINPKRYSNINKINSTINIGFTLDVNYILETMLTITSIMTSQYKTTKINFHFGVTNNFPVESMVKMYELRNKINNLTEFNFYYLRDSVLKMKNFHKKGEACPGKFELPIHLSDEIERLIIFDAGDLLVLRDLTELYNYEMGEYWALGTPEPTIINSFMKNSYNMTKYLNIGSLLLNITKLKENNFWDYYTKNRNIYLRGQPDQSLFNVLLPDDKKNYLPFKFGGYCLFKDDHNYDLLIYENFGLKNWFNSNISLSLPDNPKSEIGIILNLYNPSFIHQFYGKWSKGDGLSIYRHLAKYFILLTGISDEFCSKRPGYCQ